MQMCKLILNKKNYIALADPGMGGLGAPSSIGQKYGLVVAVPSSMRQIKIVHFWLLFCIRMDKKLPAS